MKITLTSKMLRRSFGASRSEVAKYHTLFGHEVNAPTERDAHAFVLERMRMIRGDCMAAARVEYARLKHCVDQAWGPGAFEAEFPVLCEKLRKAMFSGTAKNRK
jgi:hypothetical protein